MKLVGIVFLFLLVVSACTYDNEEDLLGESNCIENVSLTQDVQPIISAHCAVPGCHAAGGQSPNFSQTTTIVNRAVDIRNRTSNRTMPPPASGITLTSEELQTISCWVEQGANAN